MIRHHLVNAPQEDVVLTSLHAQLPIEREEEAVPDGFQQIIHLSSTRVVLISLLQRA